MATIQVDLTMLPERFDLTYIDEDGKPQRPIAIHRAIYGSLERFIGILIEHFAGAFPLWLAPVQAVVIPIADRHIEAAEELAGVLRSRGLRVEVDGSSNRMQYKIRTAQEQKVPYMVVLGDREIEARTASPRTRAGEQQAAEDWEAFADRLADESPRTGIASTVGVARASTVGPGSRSISRSRSRRSACSPGRSLNPDLPQFTGQGLHRSGHRVPDRPPRPACDWWLVGRPRGIAFPVVADILLGLPFLIDVAGNALDL